MSLPKIIVKLISVILIGLLLHSCAQYKRVPTSSTPLPSLNGRYVHLIWETGNKKIVSIDDQKWYKTWENATVKYCYMTNLTVTDDKLSGIVQKYRPHQKKKYQVNLYMDESLAPPDTLPGAFTFPVSSIKKIELYDLDVGLSIFTSIVTGVLVLALLTIILFIYIMLTKESCPFVYVHNGTDYELTGEVYSGAIYPSLERHDYLPLPNLKAVDNLYKLKISNQMQEIQSTNLAELVVIDHPLGSQVLVDKNGVCQTLQNLQSPMEAYSNQQNDILPQIVAKDDIKHLGDLNTEDKTSFETMFLSFKKPQNAGTAKLVVRAKNSYWLDYTMGQFFKQFGGKYDKWYNKQKKNPAAKQQKWSLEQGIPLSVYIKQNGAWKFVDYYNVVGPVAEKDMVMPIDISALTSDTVELKLESGFMFWETDYVGMDFSAAQKCIVQAVSLNKATDKQGKDVRNLLLKDDIKYYVMPKIGDEAVLEYAVPHAAEGSKRSVFLHSKGHYEVIRKPKGKPDVAYLKTFMEAGKFSDFSRELFMQTKRQVSR